MTSVDFKEIKRKAKEGDVSAIYKLGVFYWQEKGSRYLHDIFTGNDNMKRAIKLLNTAASRGNVDAIDYLLGISQDKTDELERLYKLAINTTNEKERFYLEWARSVYDRKNYVHVNEILDEALSSFPNNASLIGFSAYMHYNGLGVPKDLKKAFKLYNECENSNLNYTFQVASMLESGEGTKCNIYRATEMYERIAQKEEGSDLAIKSHLRLIYIYANNNEQPKAMQHLNDISEYDKPEIAYLLGIVFKAGYFVEMDLEIAQDYFDKAGVKDSSPEHDALFTPKDQSMLVYDQDVDYMALYGKENLNLVKAYYRAGVRANNPRAFMALGYMYRDGLGLLKSFDKADYCFKRAAELGFKEANLSRGELNICNNRILLGADYLAQYEASYPNDNLAMYIAQCYLQVYSLGGARKIFLRLALKGNEQAKILLEEVRNMELQNSLANLHGLLNYSIQSTQSFFQMQYEQNERHSQIQFQQNAKNHNEQMNKLGQIEKAASKKHNYAIYQGIPNYGIPSFSIVDNNI